MARNNVIRPCFGDAVTLCRRAWWMFLLGGAPLLGFGLVALASDGLETSPPRLAFAAAVGIDGAASLAGALQHRAKDGWWVVLAIGLVGVSAGASLVLSPPVASAAFATRVALQAAALGALLLLLGWRVRRRAAGEWLLDLAGALSLGFGLAILARPADGLPLAELVGAWAIAIGVLRLGEIVSLRRAPGTRRPAHSPRPPPQGGQALGRERRLPAAARHRGA